MTRRRRFRAGWCSLVLGSLAALVVPDEMAAQSDQPVPSVVSAELKGVVRGRFGARLAPLDDVLVELTTGEGRYTTRSDSEGRYALDRRDALFYSYQPWRSDDVTPLAVRPILPVFGVSIALR